MKKNRIFVLCLLCMLLFGCGKTDTNTWPAKDVLEYSKGNIVSIKNEESQYEIKVDNTTIEDYNEYIKALIVTNYEQIDALDNNDNIWTGTGSGKYVSVEYIDSTSELYNGYNIVIEIYSYKPNSWK